MSTGINPTPTAGNPPALPPAPVVAPMRRSSWVTTVVIGILAIAVLVLAGVLIYIGKKTPVVTKTETTVTTTEKSDKTTAKTDEKKSDTVPDGTVKPTGKVVGPKLPPPPEPLVTEEKTADRVEEEGLVRTMFDMSLPASDRLTAIESLGNYRYYRVARALSFILQRDTVPSLRAMAAASMGEVANSSFAKLLEHSAAKDPDAGVRVEARKALEKINARVSADKDF